MAIGVIEEGGIGDAGVIWPVNRDPVCHQLLHCAVKLVTIDQERNVLDDQLPVDVRLAASA